MQFLPNRTLLVSRNSPSIIYSFKRKMQLLWNLHSTSVFFHRTYWRIGFLKLDLLNLSNIYLATFLFYLLVIVCFDYQKQEFPSIFLIPLFSVAFIYWLQTSHAYSLIDALEFFPICLILSIYTFFHKLGSGDLIIYILLALMWNPHFANLAFLVGAIFL